MWSVNIVFYENWETIIPVSPAPEPNSIMSLFSNNSLFLMMNFDRISAASQIIWPVKSCDVEAEIKE